MMKKSGTFKKSADETAKWLGQYILEYIIYIESGHDAYKALIMLTERNDGTYVGRVINEAVNMAKNGIPLTKALSDICRRYYDVNLDTFLRIIMRGYSSGEDQMQNNLRLLAAKILHDEVANARERAEKASTKLSFPVALIFIAIVIIAMYPALAQITI